MNKIKIFTAKSSLNVILQSRSFLPQSVHFQSCFENPQERETDKYRERGERGQRQSKGEREREYKSSLLLNPNPLNLGITSIEQDLLHISSIIPPPHHEHILFDREESVQECVCVKRELFMYFYSLYFSPLSLFFLGGGVGFALHFYSSHFLREACGRQTEMLMVFVTSSNYALSTQVA